MSEADPRLAEGLRLAGAREFFAAHEVLEDLWRETEDGPWRECLQGLIQQCVALEHLRRGNALGAFNVWSKARIKLSKVDPVVRGIQVGAWSEAIEAFYGAVDLASRVRGQLEGGVAAGEEHIGEHPDLPPVATWPALTCDGPTT